MSDNTSPPSATVSISHDLEPFLRPNFDAVAYSREIVSQNKVEASLDNLKHFTNTVDKAISSHVEQHGELFLSRLGRADELQVSLESLKGCTGTLMSSLERVRQDVSVPFQQMKSKTKELENILQATELLQRVSRFLQAIRKTKHQLSVEEGKPVQLPQEGRELAKVAQLMQDVERLLDGGDLDAIHAIQGERVWAVDLGVEMRKGVEVALQKAVLAFPNQTEVRSALQAFFYLRCLPERIVDVVDWAVSMVASEVRAKLDVYVLAQMIENGNGDAKNASGRDAPDKPSDPSTSGLPSTGASLADGSSVTASVSQVASKLSFARSGKSKVGPANTAQAKVWHQALWSSVQSLENNLLLWCLRVWNLQRVLCKIPDPSNPGMTFNDIVVNSSAVVSALGEQRPGEPGNRETDQDDTTTRPRNVHVYALFWSRLMRQLTSEFTALSAESVSPFVKQVLTNEYPRLRRSLRTVLRRLHASTANKNIESVGGSMLERDDLMKTTTSFLKVYVNRSFHKLKNLVDMMFPDGLGVGTNPTSRSALPTKTDVTKFAEGIVHELVAAYDDLALVVVLCGRSKSTIQTFASKAENLVVMDEKAFRFQLLRAGTGVGSSASSSSSTAAMAKLASVTSPGMTESQTHNATLLSLVLQLCSMLGNLPLMLSKARSNSATSGGAVASQSNAGMAVGNRKVTGAVEEDIDAAIEQTLQAIQPAVVTLEELSDLILGTYLAAAAQALGDVIARVHLESFVVARDGMSPSDADMVSNQVSNYMEGVRHAVQVLQTEHLDNLPKFPRVQEARQVLLARTVSMYVRHLSLIRPLDEGGRMKLARDMAEFELAVEPLAPGVKVSELGAVYRELRAMRKLLFVDSTKLEELHAMKHEMRPSLLYHHLFSSAPSELRSPYDQARMDIPTYVRWLEKLENGGKMEPSGMEYLCCGILDVVESEQLRGNSSLRVGQLGQTNPTLHATAVGFLGKNGGTKSVEQAVLEKVDDSLESYRQRVSVKSKPTTVDPSEDVELDPLGDLADSYHVLYALRNEL